MSESTFKPLCRRDDAMAVLQKLRDGGHIAYFAGGCVRDLLLGMEPKDYDVATDAGPDRVRELFPKTQAVGAAFGVILVRQGKSVVEVATFRTDVSYADGRRPQGVKFSTPEQDAERRDFTINGLFLDPLANREKSEGVNRECVPPGSPSSGDGLKVIDYVGGLADLENRVLRAIGEPAHRFGEDHLRLLRAVRFAARFNLTIEPITAAAILKSSPFLIRISPERIAEELRMMLTPTTRNSAWRLLWAFDLPKVILRDLPETPATKPGESTSVFMQLVPEQKVPSGLALAAMVLDYRFAAGTHESIVAMLEKPAVQQSVQACRKDLKISNDEADMMKDCLNLAWLFNETRPGVAAMKRFLAGTYAQQARHLLEAIGSSQAALRPRIHWLTEQFDQLLQTDISPAPLITGEDLLAAGLSPGPLFKRVLHEVYDAQLENRMTDKPQAMQMALMLFSHHGGQGEEG